jgi:hypothetical protein
MQDPELVKEIRVGAIGIAQRKQLPVRDVELVASRVYCAQIGLEHLRLALLGAFGTGRPAGLADADRCLGA